jgi:hypothetical protein
MRAADSDRAAVATALGRHMADGRLTVEEYEERVARAYAARTYGELAELTTDLPSSGLTRPAARPTPAPAYTGGCGPAWSRHYYRSAWSAWARFALIMTAIWLVAATAGGHFIAFWPIWVVGFVLVSRTFSRGRVHHPRRRLNS